MKSSVENKTTSLLTRDENEQVFKLFDYKCQVSTFCCVKYIVYLSNSLINK